jgi:hypothetical protein
MAGRAWWTRAVHIMMSRKQRKEDYRKGLGLDITLKYTPSVTYFLHLGPSSYLSPPPNNNIIL